MPVLKVLLRVNTLSRKKLSLEATFRFSPDKLWSVKPGSLYHHSLSGESGGSSLQCFGVARVPCSLTAGISKALPIPLLVLPKRRG